MKLYKDNEYPLLFKYYEPNTIFWEGISKEFIYDGTLSWFGYQYNNLDIGYFIERRDNKLSTAFYIL